MKVAFFPGCLVDMFYPEVGIAAVNVLERLGCEVEMPKEQICCGQMLTNSGYKKELVPVAQRIIDSYYNMDYDAIVSLTGSCMSAIIDDYPSIIEDPEYKSKLDAISVRSRFFEFTEFLVDKLGVTDLGASFPHTVTYHKSCHVTRFLRVEEQPLELLRNVKGLQYIEMEHADRCCGFGGTFSVKQPEISSAIVAEKCQTVIDTGAEVLCGGDVPCLMNIKGALARLRTEGKLDRDIRVMHIAQILDARE